MKFRLTVTASFYKDKCTIKPIEDLGGNFQIYKEVYGEEGVHEYYLPEKNLGYIEINSLEELMEFYKKYGDICIVECGGEEEGTPTLEIYNGYRE